MPSAPETPASPSPSGARGPSLAERAREFAGSFAALRGAPRVFWICQLIYTVDGAAYFGLLNVLTLYLGSTLHFRDAVKEPAVSLLTGTVTLAGAIFGGLTDRLGVRRSLTLTIGWALAGRALLAAAPYLSHPQLAAWLAMVIMGAGVGVMIPAIYAGIKQSSTSPAMAAMGFSLVYGLSNGGSLLETFSSPLIRDAFRPMRLPGGESAEYAGVVWVCAALTVLYFAYHLLAFPRDQGQPVPPSSSAEEAPRFRDHALWNPRFQFFIFILLGVRTLFAHQWLTMPDYMTRAYSPEVARRFEWILMINPLLVLVGTPVFTAATRRVHVVNMMIAGTLVSAASTFLLVPGPDVRALIAYQVVFSVGEALWSSRFLEYVAEVAPPDKVGLYMGVAQIPWFLAKSTTGLYSGFLLQRFCPEHGPRSTGTLWLIYALIGLVSPIGLFLARSWLKAGSLGQAARSGTSPA